MQTVEGVKTADGLHVGIAVASWNRTITDKLLEAAVARLERLNAEEITVLRVPGALELPVAAQALATKGCDSVIAIGTIIKGETDHYEIVVRESTAGIAQVALATGVPVANAILAVHDYQHALDRAGSDHSNKGVGAADAAIEAATAMARLRES